MIHQRVGSRRGNLRGQRFYWGCTLALLFWLASAYFGGRVLTSRFHRDSIYPRAIVLESRRFSAPPNILSQQGYVLRSTDEALQIHAWYSENLGIAPRQSADGDCDHMYGQEQYFFLERRVSLTICSEVAVRTFYVQEGIHFTWPVQSRLIDIVDAVASRLGRP